MLNIKIGDKFKITSDEHNFIVSKKQTKKKDTKEDNWKNIGYYPTFEMAAIELVEAHISDLDARKLKEVIRCHRRPKKRCNQDQPA